MSWVRSPHWPRGNFETQLVAWACRCLLLLQCQLTHGPGIHRLLPLPSAHFARVLSLRFGAFGEDGSFASSRARNHGPLRDCASKGARVSDGSLPASNCRYCLRPTRLGDGQQDEAMPHLVCWESRRSSSLHCCGSWPVSSVG